MKLVFSINPIKTDVSTRNRIQPMNILPSDVNKPKSVRPLFRYNMFSSISSVSNCTSCGK